MSSLNRNQKLASFAVGSAFIVLLLGAIVAAASLPGNRLANLSGSIIEQPRYDVHPDDYVYHGLFDTYTSESSTIAEYRAVIQSRILSTDDTTIDADTEPDLAILSELVLGETDIGKISIPNYIDLYSITSLANLISAISGGGSLAPETILPSASAIHFVTSEASVILQKGLDILAETSTTGVFPSTTFELEQLGSYPSVAIPESSDGDTIAVQNAVNYTRILNATSGSNARHNCVQISTNASKGNVATIPIDSSIGTSVTSGSIGFHVKFENSDTNLDFILDGGETRIWLTFDHGTLKVREGTWKWDEVASNFVSASGDAKAIGYTISDTSWHHVVIDLNTYNHGFGIAIDPWMNLTAGTNGAAFVNSSVPLSYLAAWPSYWPSWTGLSFNATTSTSTPALVDIDDITTFSSSPDFLPVLLQDLSFYHLAILPENFNYGTISTVFQIVNDLVNKALGIIPFVIHDTSRELRISVTPVAFANISSLLETLLATDFVTLEGDVDVSLSLCWDKRVALLNESFATIDYKEVGITRRIGIELVATTKGGYPSSPDMTDYASIFQTLDDRLQTLTLTFWIGACSVGAAVTGCLLVVLLRKKRR